MSMFRFAALVTACAIATAHTGIAAPITIDANGDPWEVFHYRNTSGPRSFAPEAEDQLVVGAVRVIPNGKGEASGTPVATEPTTGVAQQAGVELPLMFFPTTVNPDQFGGVIAYDPALTGSWDITFTNGPDSLTVSSPDVVGVPKIDRPQNVRITAGASSTTPTFAWDPVAGVDSYKVSVYDLSRRNEAGGVDRIFVSDPDAGGLSFTLPSGLLSEDGLYSIEIRSTILRTDGINPSGSSQAGAAASIARSYFDFTLIDDPVSGDLFLPEVDMSSGTPRFNFDNPVIADRISFYDPLVAIGYDYEIGVGNPNFRSVLLPDIGDGIFELLLPTDDGFDFLAELRAGEEFLFADGGVSAFRVLGIETGAALDPADPTAFVTGLSFVSDGRFTGSMTPVTTEVAAVPVPASGIVLIGSLLSLGALCRSGRRRASNLAITT